MAHRGQIKICNDASSWQRPNVLINRRETDEGANATSGVPAEQQDSEAEHRGLSRNSRKRQRQVPDKDVVEPRRSKRMRKENKSDDFCYS